jgi:hypothetical protein
MSNQGFDSDVNFVEVVEDKNGKRELTDNLSNGYYLHHTCKNLDGVTSEYWRCKKTGLCRAMAILKDGKLSNSVRHTNHQSENPLRVLARRAEVSALKKAEDPNYGIWTIMEELMSLPANVKPFLPPLERIFNRLWKRREMALKWQPSIM